MGGGYCLVLETRDAFTSPNPHVKSDARATCDGWAGKCQGEVGHTQWKKVRNSNFSQMISWNTYTLALHCTKSSLPFRVTRRSGEYLVPWAEASWTRSSKNEFNITTSGYQRARFIGTETSHITCLTYDGLGKNATHLDISSSSPQSSNGIA